MKNGRSLQELAQELDRQNNSKRDFTVDTAAIELELPGAERSEWSEYREGFNAIDIHHKTIPAQQPVLSMMGLQEKFMVGKHTHGQIAAHLGIPKRHYDEMLTNHPDLLAVTVNTLFRRQPAPRFVRTLDGQARAMLSTRFRPIDNFEVAQVALEVLAGSQAQMASCEVTENRLYLKALFPKVQGEVSKGDVVQMGVVISNSEIGAGRFSVQPLILRLVCMNGMISADGGVRKAHLGVRADVNEDGFAREFAKNDTLEAMDRALMLQVRDTMRALASPDKIEMFIEKFREAAQQPIEGDVVKAVEVLQKKAGLTDDDKGGILRHLITGGDLSRWGMANAVTRYSQDVESYDKATDLEVLGGQIIELNKTDWRAIATAA